MAEMTVEGHPKSPATSSFVRLPRLNQRPEKYATFSFKEIQLYITLHYIRLPVH